MPRIKLGDDWVEGDDMSYNTLSESWNEYKLEDGTEIRMKLVVKRIVRTDRRNAAGEPVYVVQSQNIVDARVPEKLIEKPRE